MRKKAWVIYWNYGIDNYGIDDYEIECVALNEDDALELFMSFVEEELYLNFLWACEGEYVEEWSAEDNYKHLSDVAYELSMEDTYYCVEEVPCI